MAKRAKEAFVVAFKENDTRSYQPDAIVPDDVAKHPGAALYVYDDGAPAVKAPKA
jgi:hypothetical protein